MLRACFTGAALLGDASTHWIGGMGVLVFIIAIVPLSGGSNINLIEGRKSGTISW